MNDIEIYNQSLHLYDAKEYAREHGCSTPDDGAILYFKNEYPKGIDVDNDTSVYTYNKPIGKLVGHVNNGDIYLVNGKNISYYCLVKNNFENEQNMKNTVKLNESQLRKIVAESVKKVLSENCFHSRDPFETSDAEVNLNKAIYELKETVNILEKFCNNGMNEKRLLEMAQAYGERGMRFLKMSADSAM